MTLPNYLIIGAAKSGTTSLYEYLTQHPQVYSCPIKEPKFFAFQEDQKVSFAGPGDQASHDRNTVTNLETYQKLFNQVTPDHEAIGEASVLYLYSPIAPTRIKHMIPETKLIVVLRNPIERAFSSFLHLRREGREPLCHFKDALQEEEARIRAGWEHLWHYTKLGFYSVQLQRYFDLFPQEQIAVYLYDEFKANPVTVLKDIYQFLDIDSTFTPDMSTTYNGYGMPKSRLLYHYLKKPNRIKSTLKPLLPAQLRLRLKLKAIRQNMSTTKPKLSEETLQSLIQLYRDEISKLQYLLQRDFSCWLEVKQ